MMFSALWDRNCKYSFSLSQNKRENQEKDMINPNAVKEFEISNIFLNAIVAGIVFTCSGFNFLLTGIAFVAFDMGITLLDNFLFNFLPYQIDKNMPLSQRQKLVEELEKKLYYWRNQKASFEERNCNNCSEKRYSSCKDCVKHNQQIKNVDYYKYFYHMNKNIVDDELKKLKEVELEKNTKVSEDYNDKLDFFKFAIEKVAYFDNKYKVMDLGEIRKSLEKLVDILVQKPDGFRLMRATVYTYIDELLGILNAYQNLDEDKRKIYEESIVKISKYLSEDLESLRNRISNMETEDIEVSISVLLKELEEKRKEMDENV